MTQKGYKMTWVRIDHHIVISYPFELGTKWQKWVRNYLGTKWLLLGTKWPKSWYEMTKVGTKWPGYEMTGNQQNHISLFLYAEHFYFHKRDLFFCVSPFFVGYMVLTLGRVFSFWRLWVIFTSLIANLTRGTAALQNENSTVFRYHYSS